MVPVADRTFLGIGLYTPTEAAFYARVHTSTMTRWIHGNRRGEPVVSAKLPGDPERTITFLDLVQALAIRAIRREHHVPLAKIREAVNHAQERYGIEHPFAMRHETYLFGKEVHIEVPDVGLVQVSGRHKDQIAMRKVAELYMDDLTFTGEGLASCYCAFERNGRKIVIDPSRRLGQPLIESCGYTAQALLDACRTEASVEAAVEICGVDREDVELAIRYEDYLLGPAAA